MNDQAINAHTPYDERRLGPTFALDDIGWLDFESKAQRDLRLVGAPRYAVGADAIAAAWAIGAGDVTVTAVKDFSAPLCWGDMPPAVHAHHERVMRGEAVWAAWNAGFDRAIWNYATLDFHLMLSDHIIDVAAQATASGLPSDLDMAARVCGGEFKIISGRELIKLFCLPGATATPQSHPDEWREFLRYAGGDILAMRSVFLHTRQLALAEWREYWAMEQVNSRGVGIDLAMVEHAAALAGEDRTRSCHELYTLTRGEVTTVDQVKRMIHWLLPRLPEPGRQILVKREEEVDDDGVVVRPPKHALTRRTVQRLLVYCNSLLEADDSPAELLVTLLRVQRLLQIRLYGGSKTPAKFSKMLAQHIDGVLYGQYVFNGAPQTGRASSRGVQVHNLARDTLPYEHDAIEALLNRCSYEELQRLGDDTPVSRKLSLLIRPAFVPAPGRLFVWSDWSQIEAIVLPWLAGDDEGALARLQIFRDIAADPTVPDLYTRTAAKLSHIAIKNVTKPIRQRGKVAELALGFGGARGALQAMAASYGIYIDDGDADTTVAQWRSDNAWCVAFWDGLWSAIMQALEHPKIVQRAGRVAYVFLPDYFRGSLMCVLPSGRILTYRGLRFERVAELDDDDKVVGYSTQLRFSRGHGRVKLWHGLACENVVQATAADVLRGTLRRLDGFDVRLHTHDDIVLEADEDDAERVAYELREIMQHGFPWSEGLPLLSEETIAPYYTKWRES